jgi:predicted ATPase
MLKQIEIKNFRSCDSVSVIFNERVSALVGKNGVGKTNFLKAIDWVSKSSITTDYVILPDATMAAPKALSVTEVFEKSGVEFQYQLGSARRFDADTFSSIRDQLKILEAPGADREIYGRNGVVINLEGNSRTLRVNHLTPSLAALLTLLPSDDDLRGPLLEMQTLLKGVTYYDFEATSDQEHLISLREFKDWAAKYQSSAKTLTSSVAKRIIYLSENDTSVFEEFKTLLGPNGLGLINEIKVQKYGEVEDSFYLLKYVPSDQLAGTGHARAFNDVSLGTRRVIQIVLSLLFDKRGLMLIEHPEDAIHPGLLRKLISLLRTYSHDTQVIFTTHSSQVLDALKPTEVLLVTAKNGSTEIRPLSDQQIEQAKRFLDDEGSLSEFLEYCEEEP